MLRKRKKKGEDFYIYVNSFDTSTNGYEKVKSTDLEKKICKSVGRNTDAWFIDDREIATLHNVRGRHYNARKKKKEAPFLALAMKQVEKHIQKFKSDQLYFSVAGQDGLHKEVPATLMKLKDHNNHVVVDGQHLKVIYGKSLHERYRKQLKQKAIKQLKKASDTKPSPGLEAHEAAKTIAQPKVTLEAPVTNPQQEQKPEVKAQDDLKTIGQQDINIYLRQILFQNLKLAIPLFYKHKSSCAQLIQSGSIEEVREQLSKKISFLYKSEKEINFSIDQYNELSYLLGVPGGHFVKVIADNNTPLSSVPVPSLPIASSTPLVTVDAKADSTSSSHEPELLSRPKTVESLVNLSEDIEPTINPSSQIQVSTNPHSFFNTSDDAFVEKLADNTPINRFES